jgi:hypothetical protein
MHLIPLEELEIGDEALLQAKQNRTLIEYYFTCTPSLLLFILKRQPHLPMVTYLDSDLFFFADPTPIFDEIGRRSIAIIGHRFPPALRDLEQYGIYNVGWITARKDENGVDCLTWWRERCIEWCYDRCENGRFADQKYLDDWPTRFREVAVVGHRGANVAPWNLADSRVHRRDNRVWVDDQPLIFFHFHGLKQIGTGVYDLNLAKFAVTPSGLVLRFIYGPYIRALLALTRQISPFLPNPSLDSTLRGQVTPSERNPGKPVPAHRERGVGRLVRIAKGLCARRYVVVVGGWII